MSIKRTPSDEGGSRNDRFSTPPKLDDHTFSLCPSCASPKLQKKSLGPYRVLVRCVCGSVFLLDLNGPELIFPPFHPDKAETLRQARTEAQP